MRATVLDAPAEYPYSPGYFAVYFTDPDGLKLEFAYAPDPRAQQIRHLNKASYMTGASIPVDGGMLDD